MAVLKIFKLCSHLENRLLAIQHVGYFGGGLQLGKEPICAEKLSTLGAVQQSQECLQQW